ncbi:hypothetical protein C5Y96_17725 [Blastopirellula marina]|uniref:Uncharacterized protein n=1 Tax=Blastopirellula marina TaxID=124 RepID=A0A2S8F5E9_9BACT|nr:MULTISPECIES: hypothetical protein [Pirellulaceae]PQO27381.1 hypothetical protein C5Y96_17725 [Blastopirellula marina]RCS47918.1 hypothetical protein DTL36_17750 [Bremerella cremea]
MAVKEVDDVIIAVYVMVDVPADQVVADHDVAERFLSEVNSRLSGALHLDQKALNKRLINLRRRGEDNGGLPRLRNNYHGRGPNRPR